MHSYTHQNTPGESSRTSSFSDGVAYAGGDICPKPSVEQIAHLDHTDLLINSHYYRLVADHASMQATVESLQVQLKSARRQAQSPLLSFLASNGSTNGTSPSISARSIASSSSSSLVPQDFSASETTLTVKTTRKRADYPNIKFWSKAEAMAHPAARSSRSVRRPVMRMIIEKREGGLIDDNRFTQIQSHVRTACTRCLDLTKSWTKQTEAAKESYIAFVENLAEELSYCDDTGWKAVVMAQTFIDGKTRRGREKGRLKDGPDSRSGSFDDSRSVPPDETALDHNVDD